MKKNWKLQCLICKHSRKMNANAVISCQAGRYKGMIYYGSDVFTGRISCDKFDEMLDPFKSIQLKVPRMQGKTATYAEARYE